MTFVWTYSWHWGVGKYLQVFYKEKKIEGFSEASMEKVIKVLNEYAKVPAEYYLRKYISASEVDYKNEILELRIEMEKQFASMQTMENNYKTLLHRITFTEKL